MRTISFTTLAGLAALATGCGASSGDLAYQGTLDTETNGVILFEDGSTGHAGMSGTTCSITSNGTIEVDVDVTDSRDERILDGSRDDDGSVVLARTQNTLYVIESVETGWSAGLALEITSDVNVDNIVDAAITDEGAVAWGDCTVTWFDQDMGVTGTTNVPFESCSGSLVTDRATSTAFVTSGSEVAIADPSGVDFLSESGDLISFSASTASVLIAQSGSSDVQAVDIDGSSRWSTTVNGEIVQIADLGDRGEVAVMVNTGSAGSLVLLDSETGVETRSFPLPSTADMVVSGDGSTLGMVVPDAVHFYTLR